MESKDIKQANDTSMIQVTTEKPFITPIKSLQPTTPRSYFLDKLKVFFNISCNSLSYVPHLGTWVIKY